MTLRGPYLEAVCTLQQQCLLEDTFLWYLTAELCKEPATDQTLLIIMTPNLATVPSSCTRHCCLHRSGSGSSKDSALNALRPHVSWAPGVWGRHIRRSC